MSGDMDLPSPSADALAQPTRARLFEALVELRRPAGTDELATRLGLHPNGVRLHLERLQEAGLVTRERSRQARGRPRDMWLVAPDAEPGGGPPSGYSELGRWLAGAIAPTRVNLRAVEAGGREIGRDLAPRRDDASPEEAMRATLVALGFRPRRDARPGGRLVFRLGNCPYRDAVRDGQEVVCALHRGITRGLVEEIAPRARLADFVPKDPYAAGCVIEIEGMASGRASG